MKVAFLWAGQFQTCACLNCLSSLIQAAKRRVWKIIMLNMRGLLKENPFMKIVGQPWKEGEIRVEVDKYHFG